MQLCIVVEFWWLCRFDICWNCDVLITCGMIYSPACFICECVWLNVENVHVNLLVIPWESNVIVGVGFELIKCESSVSLIFCYLLSCLMSWWVWESLVYFLLRMESVSWISVCMRLYRVLCLESLGCWVHVNLNLFVLYNLPDLSRKISMLCHRVRIVNFELLLLFLEW